MRQLAILVVLVGCGTDESPKKAVAPTGKANPSDLVCSPPTPSGLRGKDPKSGGYVVLDDDAAVAALNTAIETGVGFQNKKDQSRFDALEAAMHDSQADIQLCFRSADGANPEAQYELVLTVNGDAAGSRVVGTSVKRVDGVNPDHTPVLAKTNAEACVAKLFARLSLPPGYGQGELHTFTRYDFCNPRTAIALATASVYADAYRRWAADHRNTPCPASLSDLNSYARRANTDDPWSQPYVMRCSADGFDVMSAGPDRRLGTADDLASRQVDRDRQSLGAR